MTYNVALKVAIIQSKFRQIDVAAKAGINNSKFSHIILGRAEPTIDEKKAIAKVLKRPIADLFPDEATA